MTRSRESLALIVAVCAWAPYVVIVASAIAAKFVGVAQQTTSLEGRVCYASDALLPAITCHDHALLEAFLNAWLLLPALPLILSGNPLLGWPLLSAVVASTGYLVWYHVVFRKRRLPTEDC